MGITFYLFLISFFMGIVTWFVFLGAIKSGQFRDAEKLKYKVLEAEEIKEDFKFDKEQEDVPK